LDFSVFVFISIVHLSYAMADYDDDDGGMWNAGGDDDMLEGVSR